MMTLQDKKENLIQMEWQQFYQVHNEGGRALPGGSEDLCDHASQPVHSMAGSAGGQLYGGSGGSGRGWA